MHCAVITEFHVSLCCVAAVKFHLVTFCLNLYNFVAEKQKYTYSTPMFSGLAENRRKSKKIGLRI